MKRVDILRDNIIDKLMTISNADYLSALYQLVENSSVDRNVVELSEEQVRLLRLSEADIENGRLISQADLDKMDLKWLKGL
jgi:hypothetical protein